MPGFTSGRPGSPGARDVQGGPGWATRGYNKPGGAMWTDPFTPYKGGEPIKYQDEKYASYSTSPMDNPGSRGGTPKGSASARSMRADARALFKQRLAMKQQQVSGHCRTLS